VGGHPIIDVACGSGRNGIFLAQLGCSVICLDRDLSRLPNDKLLNVSLKRHQMDLITDEWPFAERTIGGILLVDFLHLPLFENFERSLIPGGYFLIETVTGRGGNYLELPSAGELRNALKRTFELEFYRESKVGPENLDRVSVKVLARRKDFAGTTTNEQLV